MTITEILSRADKPIRRLMSNLSPQFTTFFYSYSRKPFLRMLSGETVPNKYIIDKKNNTTLWDITFNIPLFNAAGMFKNGDGYYTVANQGAGAFLAGTTTKIPRKGNIKNSIIHPFAPLSLSGVAINWMGLPNPGHRIVARRLSNIEKVNGCPIGASIASDTDVDFQNQMKGILFGLQQYDKAGVDFIELNESCPNVSTHKSGNSIDQKLLDRLDVISTNFLKKRKRNLPVILKISVDTNADDIPNLIDILIDMEFDGINLGNTSTDYEKIYENINSKEKKLFNYFTSEYGGGVSGKPLKQKSLNLASKAADHLSEKDMSREFHIIRTGGIENISDVNKSLEKGISLCQWFTAYFEDFGKLGHGLYYDMFKDQ